MPTMRGEAARLPVNVLTGFLGSGKTTLLRALLASPALADTAVLINEFGEVGLDHLLVERLDEATVLLQSGCICCTIREDLSKALTDLHLRRERGQVPPFDRLVVETTGLADPVPVLATIRQHPALRHHFRLGNVIATVDGVLGGDSLGRFAETAKQVAVADRLVVTKTDIAPPDAVEGLTRRLRRINPAADLIHAVQGAADAGPLFAEIAGDAEGQLAEAGRWLSVPETHGHGHGHGYGIEAAHGDGIEAFCITLDRPIEWSAFAAWLTMLLHRHGDRILRVKGILDVAQSETPVAVHGVQHLVHPPSHLAAWPDGERRSRLVFIGHGLSPALLRRSLAAFQALGATLAG